MTQNDFYVSIQSILLNAMEQGWSISQIEDYAVDAVDEFVLEYDIETGE